MAKYKKQEVHMVDMSGRLKMKIVHEEFTSEDELAWEREMEEMNARMEQHMKRYEQQIEKLFISATNDPYINDPKRNDEYFIKTYGDKFIGRNPDNIENRLKLYNKYLEDQD